MMMPTFFLLQMSTISSMIALVTQRKHLLMALLTLEMMILSLILLIPSMILMNNSKDTSIILAILTMGACEASIGLASLVLMTRMSGNDLLKSLNSNKC